MIKRTVALAIALATPLLAQTASAGELTMFENPNFQGRAVTLRGDAHNLLRAGFNDRASSMVVRSGRWQICEDVEFGGRCGIFEPGEYPALDRLGDRISSAREIGGAGDGDRGQWRDRAHEQHQEQWREQHEQNQDQWREQHEQNQDQWRERHEQHQDQWRDQQGRYVQPRLELYTNPGLGGDRVVVEDFVVRSLRDRNFNDRAQSLAVRGGEWQVCMHANFGGRCAVYGPGEYGNLGRLSGQISSVRLVSKH